MSFAPFTQSACRTRLFHCDQDSWSLEETPLEMLRTVLLFCRYNSPRMVLSSLCTHSDIVHIFSSKYTVLHVGGVEYRIVNMIRACGALAQGNVVVLVNKAVTHAQGPP